MRFGGRKTQVELFFNHLRQGRTFFVLFLNGQIPSSTVFQASAIEPNCCQVEEMLNGTFLFGLYHQKIMLGVDQRDKYPADGVPCRPILLPPRLSLCEVLSTVSESD